MLSHEPKAEQRADSESSAKALSQKKSAKKQQDKEASSTYQKSLTAYCNNTGNADSVKYDGDGGVTFKVDNSTLSDATADKKSLATELVNHANKLANMCDVSQTVLNIQTQSGDPIARTTLGGGVKVYK
ncbi:hypothetical protein [Secundilactobacillus mixtipabuli]|uniref:Uncharacterized protein n=1 Tax=Secundilactobacillus mixtipabuli TaxID=1435342 RepID=A0A1Z5IE11_9LACO|nr:hypothetical protein [Secundilactobacillus mixtipabuli]GAW99690.1 hypothetical protein IWT30_01660 [Secundilactobacillus mixtipabuli]